MTTISLRALRGPALTKPARCESRRTTKRLLARLREGFVPARAPGVDAVIEWQVDTGDDVERFQLAIRGGKCTFRRRAERPTVTIGLGIDDLRAIVEHRVAPTRLFMSQRLTISGDVLMASRLSHFLLG